MFFYLKWEDKRPSVIQIVNEKPEKINFQNTFKIKSVEHTICGFINPNFKEYLIPKLPYRKTNYLLSHLQKSVRRMDDMKSIKTAKHLIDLDYNSFIRRLPIIMLEDVNIHSCLPIIVWLMIANTKGFKLKVNIVKWLLGVIYHLSNCPEKIEYSNEDIGEIEIENEDIILQTLRFRKAYGGMKGDLNMVEYFIHNIQNENIKINDNKIPIVGIDFDNLHKNEWIIEANDFHCNRYITEHIFKKFPQYEKDYIKKLIWEFSSSINKRTNPKKIKSLEKDWNIISGTVRVFQKNCIFY